MPAVEPPPAPSMLALLVVTVMAGVGCPENESASRDRGFSSGSSDAAADLGSRDGGDGQNRDQGVSEDMGSKPDLGGEDDMGPAEDLGVDMGPDRTGPPSSWTFVNIADNVQFPSMAFGQLSTDLDGQGRVVWRAFREEGGTATWGSDGVVAVAPVYEGGPPGSGDFYDIERPVLTEGGVFAGYYNENPTIDQAIVVGDIGGRPLTFVAGRGVDDPNLDGFFNFLSGPTVNESGQAAFCSVIEEEGTTRTSCFRGDGSETPTDVLLDTDYQSGGPILMDESGGVWVYARDVDTFDFALVYVDALGNLDVRLSEADVAPNQLTNVVALDAATGRCLMAIRSNAGWGVRAVDEDGSETLVEVGRLERVRAIGVEGPHVVLSVDRDGSLPGALLRADALDDPILEVGDTFRGATLTAFFYGGGVNASGQISVSYVLDRPTDGSAESGVARGDPSFD